MAAWRTSTSPCWTCRATRHPQIPRPTCAPRSPGTSALTRVRRSGFARPQALDFDPLTDVQTFADLRRFPNLVDELRSVPVEDLIPRGYGSPAPIPRIFESGGTTGAPKRTAQLPDWVEQVTRWQVEDFTAGGFVPGRGLAVPDAERPARRWVTSTAWSPSGWGRCSTRSTWIRGGSRSSPPETRRRRWPPTWTTCWSRRRYVLETQDVVNLHATPPLVEAIARDDGLVDLVNSKIRYLLLSGAHVDMDTLDLLRQIFPNTAIAMAFGSTMVLSQAATRVDGDSFVFDPRSPYVVFWVIDPETGAEVPYGERGQVVMNHISKGMFIPNNLERDTAIRMPGPDGQVGDSVSEVAPVAVFGGEPVIEGVY